MVQLEDPQSTPIGAPDTTLLDRQIDKGLEKRGYKSGSGSSGGDGIDIGSRVDTLESKMLAAANDIAWIKERIGKLPTSAGLWGMVATSIAVSIAIIGAIIMTFQFKYQISPSTTSSVAQIAPPQPIIIQMPAYQPSSAQHK